MLFICPYIRCAGNSLFNPCGGRTVVRETAARVGERSAVWVSGGARGPIAAAAAAVSRH